MPHHLREVEPPPDDDRGEVAWDDDGDLDEDAPLVRPPWWRWVAIAVILAMVVATPFAYLLSRLLD